VDFLQIKQKSSEPIYSVIERFEKQLLRVKDRAFDSNDLITRKTFIDVLLPKIRGKQEGARFRTYQEAHRGHQSSTGPQEHSGLSLVRLFQSQQETHRVVEDPRSASGDTKITQQAKTTQFLFITDSTPYSAHARNHDKP
jgi:hypothetical protein